MVSQDVEKATEAHPPHMLRALRSSHVHRVGKSHPLRHFAQRFAELRKSSTKITFHATVRAFGPVYMRAVFRLEPVLVVHLLVATYVSAAAKRETSRWVFATFSVDAIVAGRGQWLAGSRRQSSSASNGLSDRFVHRPCD